MATATAPKPKTSAKTKSENEKLEAGLKSRAKKMSTLQCAIGDTKFDGDADAGVLTVDGVAYGFSDRALKNFFRTLDIPSKYYSDNPDFRDEILKYHKSRKDATYINPVLRGNQIIGFTNPKKPLITAHDAYQAIRAAADDAKIELQVREAFDDEYGVILSFSAPGVAVTPRVDDIVEGGVRLLLNEAGESDPELFYYSHRLICTNGMTAAEDGQHISVLSRSTEDVQGQIQEIAARLIGQVEDFLLSPFANQTKHKVDDPVNTARSIAQDRKFTRKMTNLYVAEVQAMLQDHKGDVTMYEMINWLTQLGSRKFYPDADLRQIWDAQSAGGAEVVSGLHRCKTCKHILV